MTATSGVTTATTRPATTTTATRGPIWFPSIISGIVLGIIFALIGAEIVSRQVVGNEDAAIYAGYTGWLVGFLLGIGAFNGLWEWGFGSQEMTHEQELQNAGSGEGVWRYFRFCTDHKVVGIQYLVTVLITFFIGSMGAFMIRLQQSRPENTLLTPSTYNTIVGLHGIIMIISTIVMISGSFGNFVLPISLGARDMAFPRLNALSYWLFFPVIPVLLSTLFLGGFPTGWTGYAPLADQAQVGMDAYSFTIIVFALSVTVSGMNIVTTIITLRTRGMTMGRIPIFVWATGLSVLLGLIAFPSFMLAQTFVATDRMFNTSFYIGARGGSNWLYEHLFWFMGHPEVYVIALPAFGVAAEIAAVFCRKPVYGYPLLVGSMMGIFVLSFTVWSHHLYLSGSTSPMNPAFMLSTELISIPTGVLFFAMVGTFWRGRIWVTPALLFVVGLLVNFIIGGVTGIYLADVPTDVAFHGNMFVTAHFHFTLVGGMVFGFFAGVYYWFPKMFGKQLDQTLGKIHFWLFEIGFVGTFMALFYAGLHGQPRWMSEIPPAYGTANTIASLFAILIALSVFTGAWNIIKTLLWGEPITEANVWGGRTLEWTIPTPVPLENFPSGSPVVDDDPYGYGRGAVRPPTAVVGGVQLTEQMTEGTK